MTITHLYEDLEVLLNEAWKKNSKATEAQKKDYPQNRKISKGVLGIKKDGSGLCLKKAYAYADEKGFDDQPVFSVSARSVQGFFWDNEEHEWAKPVDLLRFGLFMHLSPWHIIHLMVKAQWEKFFWYAGNRAQKDEGQTLFGCLANEKEAVDFSDQFVGRTAERDVKHQIDYEAWYALLQRHGELGARLGFANPGKEQKPHAAFREMIQRLVHGRIHLKANHSAELTAFIESEQETLEMLRLASDEIASHHWTLRCRWNELGIEEGNRLQKLEALRLENENIKQQWQQKFGRGYLLFVNAEHIEKCLRRRLDWVGRDGEENIERIKQQEQHDREQEEQNLMNLKMEIDLSLHASSADGKILQGNELMQYKEDCKKVLRKIWKLTYEDFIQASDFTKAQKKKLRDYFDQATEINNSVKFYDKLMQIPRENVGYNLPQLSNLKEILRRVEAVYTTIGIDIPEETLVQGESLEEQCGWYEKNIAVLEGSIQNLKNESLLLSQCKSTLEMKAAISNPTRIKSLRIKMIQRIEELLGEIGMLAVNLEERLQQGASEDFQNQIDEVERGFRNLKTLGKWE